MCAVVLAMACAGAPGCGESGAMDAPDAAARPDRSVGGGADALWATEVVDEGDDVGLHVRLAVDEGGASHVAYFATEGEVVGPCDLGVEDDVPEEVRWTLRYATEAGSGWAREEVARVLSPGDPPGLALALDGSDPVIAAITGGPVEGRLCQADDLGLHRRSAGWAPEVVVEESAQAATGMPASDFGTVVGHWPGLAIDGERFALAYKDVHNGSIQTDDLTRADLELALGGGGAWSHVAVDPGRGAGSHNRAAFDARGRLVIAFVNPVEEIGALQQGLWVVRTADGGESWERVLLAAGPMPSTPALAVRGSRVHVLAYDAGRGVPRLHSLEDDMAFEELEHGWTNEVLGDPRYHEGLEPSLGVDRDGRLGAAWFRCARASDGLGSCDRESGLMFAWEDDGVWELERVTGGETREECGMAPALAFGPDGDARVAYRCQRDGVEQVHLARREPL